MNELESEALRKLTEMVINLQNTAAAHEAVIDALVAVMVADLRLRPQLADRLSERLGYLGQLQPEERRPVVADILGKWMRMLD